MQTTSQSCPRRKSSDRMVLEAETAHALRLPQIAPVEDGGALELPAQSLEVQVSKLVPLCHEHHGVRAVRRRIGRITEGDEGGKEAPRIVHGRRIVHAHARPRRVQELNHLEALGLAHIVGIGLEGQAEHGHRLVVEGAQGLGDALHEVGGALAVDLDHRAQELEVIAEPPRGVNERVHVFGKAGAAVA